MSSLRTKASRRDVAARVDAAEQRDLSEIATPEPAPRTKRRRPPRALVFAVLAVLFAVLLGANLFGVVGMVMGVPVFATLYGLAGEAVRWLLDRRGIDEDGVRIVRPESAAEAAVHIRGDEDAPAPDQPAGPADRP